MTGPQPTGPIEHGTPHGYRKHKALKTPICDPCRDSYNTWQRMQRGTRRQQRATAEATNRALAVETERRTGMPRWCLNPAREPVAFSDSELEIAARRKVLEDYHTTMEEVS